MNEKMTVDESNENSSYQINNPEEFSRNIVRLFEEGNKVVNAFMQKPSSQSGPYSGANELAQAAKTLGTVLQNWLQDPARISQAQGDLLKDYGELWTRSVQQFLGKSVSPVAEPEPGDNRFKDPDWDDIPYFNFIKQAYLLTACWAEQILENSEGVDEQTRQKAEFYLEQISSALSPSNFALTNPEVIRETLASDGENLVKGLGNLHEDIKRSDDLFRISQTDIDAFRVGENLAVTPGNVVYQNDIIQLIQYTPTTEKVYETPLLIVPPWINKFYILDLVPQKSFIKWTVSKGFTVFVISWVNPDSKLSEKTFEDYMNEGVSAATDAVCKATGVKKINALGYCVGGTLLATTLAQMAESGDKRIRSATYLAAQVDFSKAGDLLVFIDDQQLKQVEDLMEEHGYLDGSRMASVFNFLRPRDLIWPYVINNYLLGKSPLPFDLLYWNQDSTRMPAANHSFYLREFYDQNNLAEGRMTIGGKTLDLSKVNIPIYELATKEDHIAPAESVYIGSKLFGGSVRFVLSGSGHIAGVVNPPDKQKYQYWTNSESADDYGDWFSSAKSHKGSWWPDWAKWLGSRSGKKVDARRPDKGGLKVIEDAPGSYVRVTS